MRRLAEPFNTERGAVAVLVALLMVVLLGFAAIAVDVARLYSERAQLQNGADAVALMVAQKCAKDTGDANCHAAAPDAKALASMNAVDSLSNVKSIVVNTSTRTAKVTTGAEESGAPTNSVNLFFAGVLGIPASEVVANSSAEWGTPRSGRTVFPLAFSKCQIEGNVGSPGPLQRLQSHSFKGSGANKNCPAPTNSSGSSTPGGFGWLPIDPGSCGTTVNLDADGGWVTGSPGNKEPTVCAAQLTTWANELSANREVVLHLPVFDLVESQGDNSRFHLVSFAAFSLTGWKLSGPNETPYAFRNTADSATGVTTETECLQNCRGVIGRFINYVSLADEFKLGPVGQNPNGAYVVRLTP